MGLIAGASRCTLKRNGLEEETERRVGNVTLRGTRHGVRAMTDGQKLLHRDSE